MNPRIPTQYSLHRAFTGRFASGTTDDDMDKKRKQNQLQNIPHKLRDSIVPDPGHVFVGADWSGLQWAFVMLFCSKLPGSRGHHAKLLERFTAGELDAHRYLASHAFDKPEDRIKPHERKVCKPYTHGYNFDGAPTTLARDAGHKDSVGKKVCAAHDAAFRTREWKEWQYAQACKKKHVQTPLGWRMYFWGYKPKKQEILADIVQATEGCLMKWTLCQMRKDPAGWSLQPNNQLNCLGILAGNDPIGEMLSTTHDSMLMQIREDYVEEGAAWLKQHMEQPVPWLDGRSWPADVKTGMSWKEVS